MLCVWQPSSAPGSPTAILPTTLSLARSTFHTVPSPEFATHANPLPTAIPAGLTPVWMVTVRPCGGEGDGAVPGPEQAMPAGITMARTDSSFNVCPPRLTIDCAGRDGAARCAGSRTFDHR